MLNIGNLSRSGLAMWLWLFILSALAGILFSLAAIVQLRTRIGSIPGRHRRARDYNLLLFRQMRLLGPDPAVVARAEPLAFRQIEERCLNCHVMEHCACDLAAKAGAAEFGKCPDYCPNGPTLDTLSALKPGGEVTSAPCQTADQPHGVNLKGIDLQDHR
jgi:hypothetical protein